MSGGWAGSGEASCDVFWGSHGCGLAKGHPDQDRHVCGDSGDGMCSTVSWAQDEHTGLWVWDWRFSDDGETAQGTAYVPGVWGADLPVDRQVSDETTELVRAVRESAGLLPVMIDGQWRKVSGEPWAD